MILSTSFQALASLSLCSLSLLTLARCSPTPSSNAGTTPAKSASSSEVSVTLNGATYVNKGLVGLGVIPSDFRESTGDTLGGIGSAMAIKYGTWKAQKDGTFKGTFVVHPDRGYNVLTTIDYQARQHEIDFVLTPYYGSAKLNYTTAQRTLKLTYKQTTLQVERNNVKTSGLDGLAVRPAQEGYPAAPLADPQMPIASLDEPHLVIDAEGIVSNSDGSFWVSDEYGPYIYRFSATGHLIQTIQPPAAILPLDSSRALNFTSEVNPATGRVGNHGFEGLTLDTTNNILYAMLQAATVQDGGGDQTTSRYTRLFGYDVSNPLVRPKLVGEWVVPLPQTNGKGNTLVSSEILFLSPGVFLSLSRDGKGRGDTDTDSKHKQADLFDISGATDIHDSKFDDPANPVAANGVLDPSITPATYVSFVDYLDKTQLARFGLHNDLPDDTSLIDAKWESLALAPVYDKDFPDDFFLFTASDNDFISTNGVSLGVPFDAGMDVDNQFLVFRVTLPGLSQNCRL